VVKSSVELLSPNPNRLSNCSARQRTALNGQLTHCLKLWEEELLVRQLAFDDRLCSLAAALLDAPGIRLIMDQTFLNELGTEPTSRHHQDITFRPARGRFLTAWTVLDDVTDESVAWPMSPDRMRSGRLPGSIS
jgi:hypothetical protein